MALYTTLKCTLMFLGIICLLTTAVIIIEIAILLGMETWDRHKRNRS